MPAAGHLENGPASPHTAEINSGSPARTSIRNSATCGVRLLARGSPTWIWIPAHFPSWTPGGYWFYRLYWYYEQPVRGCLFAPVYFAQPDVPSRLASTRPPSVFAMSAFHQRLLVRFGLSTATITLAIICAPVECNVGFSPCFCLTTIGRRPRWIRFYCYRWHNSSNARTARSHAAAFDQLRRDESSSSAATFAAQQQWRKNNPGGRFKHGAGFRR